MGAIAATLAVQWLQTTLPPNNAGLLWHGAGLICAVAVAVALWIAGRAARIGGLAFAAVSVVFLANSLILQPRQIMAEARAIAGDAPYCLATERAMTITGGSDLTRLSGWHAPLHQGWSHVGNNDHAPLMLAVADQPRDPISAGRNLGVTLWGWDPATGSFVQRERDEPRTYGAFYTLNCITAEDWLDQPRTADVIEIKTKAGTLRVPSAYNPDPGVPEVVIMAGAPDFEPNGLIYSRSENRAQSLELWPSGASLDWATLTAEDLAPFEPSDTHPDLLTMPEDHPLREPVSLPFHDHDVYVAMDETGQIHHQIICWDMLCMHMVALNHREGERENPVMIRYYFPPDQLGNWQTMAAKARAMAEPMIVETYDIVWEDS